VHARGNGISGRGAPSKKKLAAQRRNMRTKELKVLHWYILRSRENWDSFFADLQHRQFRGRDPRDPDEVPAQELGLCLPFFTLATKMAVEDKRTEHGRRKGWARRDGQPYRFRFTTIAPNDHTPEEAKRVYKDRSNAVLAKRRRAQRAAKFTEEAKAMQTMQQPTSYATYADAVAAQRARTRNEAEALYAALAAGERTIAELMAAVRRNPLWKPRAGDNTKFRQAVVNRLEILSAEGRIADRYEPRPQGGSLRVIRRSNTQK
jgi:hypothetical protein